MDQQPQAGSPQQPAQSHWTPPPQHQSGWAQSGTSAPPIRPAGVTFAGIFLIVMGVLFALFALVAFVGGAAFSSFLGAEMGDLFASIFAIFAIILVVFAVAHFAAGIGSLQGKNWARVTGIVVSVVVIIFMVLGLVGAAQADPSGMVLSLAVVVLYGLAVWGLAKAGSYFAYNR